MVDELKRLVFDAESIQAIMKGADEFANLWEGFGRGGLSPTACLLSDIKVVTKAGFGNDQTPLHMLYEREGNRLWNREDLDPVWQGAMEYHLLVSIVVKKLGQSSMESSNMILSLS